MQPEAVGHHRGGGRLSKLALMLGVLGSYVLTAVGLSWPLARHLSSPNHYSLSTNHWLSLNIP